MRLAFVLSILMLSACGQPIAPAVVDPKLAPYLASFETDIGASSAGINAQFADTENVPGTLGEVVGECVFSSDGSRTIQVDTKYWASIDESQRIQLMYHELGHCALYMGHITTYQSDHCPTSIMFPYTFGDQPCFTENEAYYFQELSSHK